MWFWYLILLIINTTSLFIWVYRFVPINQYNFAIRRIKLLRVRLIENSKVPKNSDNEFKDSQHYSRDFRLQSTVLSNEKYGSSKKTAISHILSENDYRYSVDEATIDNKDKQRKNEKIFPNNSSNYLSTDSDVFLNKRAERVKSNQTNTTYEPTLKSMRIPISNEYDNYMKPNSFCKTNYRAFVYDYLEADGKQELSENLNLLYSIYFAYFFLKGMFMLRMIGSNSGDFVCTQVLHNLWKLFLFKKFVVKNDRPNKKEQMKSSKETNNYSSDEDEDEDESEEFKEEAKPKPQVTNFKVTRLQQKKKKNPFFHKLFKETPSTSKRILENRSFRARKKPITVFSSLHLGKENVIDTTTTPNIKYTHSIKRIVNHSKIKL